MEHKVNKKPVFDAVRLLLGRRFTQDEVAALDCAIDRALGARRPLGALSERFESGGRGPGAVSSGVGDPGGVSYGIWQLSSKAGTAAQFVAEEGARWRAEFAGNPPGTVVFSAAWRAIASREPDAFGEAQRSFIERTHYRPAVAAVRRATKLDLDARQDAVRDAVWSVAVQHGAAARILGDAVARADAVTGRMEAGYDRALVEAIYAVRTDYVLRLAARSGAAARRTLENVAKNRYSAELADALEMLA